MRRAPRAPGLPSAPRLPTTQGLRRLDGAVLEDDAHQDATLADTRLRGCDLTGAVWFGAKLAGADLRGSTLDDLKMRAGDLAGAVIDPVQLVAIARPLATLSGPYRGR